MSTHYNAFISYKHEKKDSRIAALVQKNLENYSIPSKIKKATGVKRINRIFRDKNELPTTSNLSDTILDALNNSDYLIVICSTKTKESEWVSREIEFFLRTHTKDKVLTVLVDGEPGDVIPGPLLYDEKTVYNNLGMPTTIRENLEPLSCDFRMPVGRAKRIELPRLAAALIGCSYNDLMNRHRQYVMRRVILASAAAIMLSLLFAGYMFYSRRQVQKNYVESLKNQSRFLANESDYLMEKFQRMTALQLALEALPKDENDPRPVIPEAVGALTRACYAYRAYSGSRIDSDCSYKMVDVVKHFTISPDGRYLAAEDKSANVAIWNLEDYSRVYYGNAGGWVNNIEFMQDDSLVYYGDNKVVLVDAKSGTAKWTYKLDKSKIFSSEALVVSDEYIYLPTSDDKLMVIDPKDGTPVNEYDVPTGYVPSEEAKNDTENNYYGLDASLTDAIQELNDLVDSFSIDGASETDADYSNDIYLSDTLISEENDKIVYTFNSFSDRGVLMSFDTKTGKSEWYDQTPGMISETSLIDKDHVMIQYLDDVYNSSSTLGDTKIQMKNHSRLVCLDLNTMQASWDMDFESTETVINTGFLYIEENDSVTFYNGNIYKVINASNGEVLYEGDVNDSIIYAFQSSGAQIPYFITRNGNICYPAGPDDPDKIVIRTYFSDELDIADIRKGSICVHQNSSKELISYRSGLFDESWKRIKTPEDTFETVPDNYFLDDDICAYFPDKSKCLTMINLNDEDYDCQMVAFDDGDDYVYEIMGAYNGKLYLTYTKDEKQMLIAVDKTTGEKEETVLSDQEISAYSALTEDDPVIYFYSYDENYNHVLCSYDLTTKETKEYNIQRKDASNSLPEFFMTEPVSLKSQHSVFCYNDAVNRIVDTESGELIDINQPEIWMGTNYVSSLDGAGLYAVSDGRQILIVSPKGETLYTLQFNGKFLAGVKYFKQKDGTELILVIQDNGTIVRYNVSDGSFAGNTVISEMEGETSYDDTIYFQYDESKDILYIRHSGFNALTAIDTESWVPYFVVEACFGYHKGTDRFITYGRLDSDKYAIGYFQKYSTEELKEKARAILNGAELSDEQKSQYGISDD
ncbi:MAG: TIR domain-containing protein [Eubacterium sp.]|nr:TIR domain-containing protein [Eubacterium sp.]